jgi:hypothetical protein
LYKLTSQQDLLIFSYFSKEKKRIIGQDSNMRDKNNSNNERDERILDTEIFGAPVVPADQEDRLGESEEPINEAISNQFPDQADGLDALGGLQKPEGEKSLAAENDNIEAAASDIDTAWSYQSQTTGEEDSGGGNATPDKDQTHEIGRPWGLGYRFDQELNVDRELNELEAGKNQDEDEAAYRRTKE